MKKMVSGGLKARKLTSVLYKSPTHMKIWSQRVMIGARVERKTESQNVKLILNDASDQVAKRQQL